MPTNLLTQYSNEQLEDYILGLKEDCEYDPDFFEYMKNNQITQNNQIFYRGIENNYLLESKKLIVGEKLNGLNTHFSKYYDVAENFATHHHTNLESGTVITLVGTVTFFPLYKLIKKVTGEFDGEGEIILFNQNFIILNKKYHRKENINEIIVKQIKGE